MKAGFLSLLVLIVLISCKEDKLDMVCNVSDPVNDLPWLKAKAAEIDAEPISEYFFLEQAEYNGAYIFTISNCCELCYTIPFVYDCQGNSLDASVLASATNRKVIWKSSDNICALVAK
jgi:hypothetical protein